MSAAPMVSTTIRPSWPKTVHGAQIALAGARCTLLGLLIPVAFGRWGSYLGISLTGVSVSDILVIVGIASYMFVTGIPRQNPPLTGLYAVCVIFVLLVSIYTTPHFSNLVIRDAAPIAYLLLVPLFLRVLRSLDGNLVRKWVYRALFLHTIWYLPISLGLLRPISLSPLSSVPAFTARNDFDTMISGIAIVAAFVLSVGRWQSKVLLVIGASVCMLANGSRAGFFAAILGILIYFVLCRPWRNRNSGPYVVAACCAATAFSILIVGAGTFSTRWSKVLSKIIPSDSTEYASAVNTSDARSAAWARIANYIEYQDRELFGVGFGTNYIQQSGAIEFLSGDVSVRQPHNFLVSWYAMLGTVGTSVLLTVIALLLWQAVRIYQGGDLQVLGWAIVAGIFVTSLAGVILESPFGYGTFVLGVGLIFREPTNNSDIATERLSGASDGFARGEDVPAR